MTRPLAVIGFSFLASLLLLQTVDRWLFTVAFGAAVAVLLLMTMLLRRLREQKVFPTAAMAALTATLLFATVTWTVYQPALELVGEAQVKAQIISLPEESDGRTRYIFQTDSINGVPKKVKLRYSTEFPLQAELQTGS